MLPACETAPERTMTSQEMTLHLPEHLSKRYRIWCCFRNDLLYCFPEWTDHILWQHTPRLSRPSRSRWILSPATRTRWCRSALPDACAAFFERTFCIDPGRQGESRRRGLWKRQLQEVQSIDVEW